METRKTVLLVEDSRQDELLMLRALSLHGLREDVVVCRDGAEALDWIFARGRFSTRDASVLPDVVFLDLKLPKIDGIEVLSVIRHHPPTRYLPVVILTTSREESDVAKSYAGGANSFVQKPISYDEFSELIKRLGVYWLMTNEPPLPSQLVEGSRFQ